MIELRAGSLEAAFAPDAGMVGCSLRHRGEELLGQREGLDGWVERKKTFGIPLLHPWANRLGGWSYGQVELDRESPFIKAEEHGLPIHGLLHGLASWEVVSADAASAEAALAFDRPQWLAAFPFPHALRLQVSLSPTALTLALTLRATGVMPVPLAFGWHPYLTLPGVEFADWSIATSVRSRMVADDRGIPTGEVVDAPVEPGPLGSRAFDDGFADGTGAWFTLRGGGREVAVRFGEGYTHAQLFVDQDNQLLAFEPMMAPTDALRSGRGLRSVAPGREARATFEISVRDT